MPSWFRRYLLPGLVFQSIIIAGGYGTGREAVEFFLEYGAVGGLLGMVPATILVSLTTHRKARYGEQGGHCAGCSEHFQSRHLEVDHIVSRAKGGTDHIENLQLLCGSCSRIKGDRGMEYLRVNGLAKS